ncbi:MAG TPA: hypothetical protein VF310_02075, partial [Vicinamibacteria bacterium]
MNRVNRGRRPLFARRKRLVVLLLDLMLFLNAYAGAFLIRADLRPYPSAWHHFEQTVLTLMLAKALVFVLAGTYRGLVMYATIPDLLAIVRTATLASAAVWVAFTVFPGHRPYSRGVLVIDWMLTLGLVAASRVAYRLLLEGRAVLPAGPLKRVLIVGAGRSGVSLAKDLMTARRQDVELVGFVDDDPEKQDSTLLGR